jgi:Flp pilus assembly pilin Flp
VASFLPLYAIGDPPHSEAAPARAHEISRSRYECEPRSAGAGAHGGSDTCRKLLASRGFLPDRRCVRLPGMPVAVARGPRPAARCRVRAGSRLREAAMNVVIRLRALWREESGQDLLEYALLGSLIALVCYVAVDSTGSTIFGFYDRIAAKFDGIL